MFHLKLIKKEIYLSFLLSIILFASIDILFYNYITLGNEEDDDNNNDVDDVREKEEYKDEEDIENTSINELFDNDNNDNRDNNDEIIEKEDTEENVPFILPFNAVPFP
jgi:hypothetical protein